MSAACKNRAHFFIFKISSAEQSNKQQSFESVASEGCALPEQYCDIVGLDTPNAFAISVLAIPEVSISRLIFSEIISVKFFVFIITLLGIA